MSSKTWAQATARRIGAGSEFNFTPTRVGCTLHLPCRGWGRNHPPHIVDVTIPPGQNPEAVAKKLMQAGWTVGSRLKCPNKPEKKKEQTPMDKETRAAGMGGTSSRAMAAALPPVAANAEQDEELVLLVVEAPAKETPSQAAGKARRFVYMALEDYYDEPKRLYKPGHTDATIAKQCGVAEQVVKTIREESYGPLAEPDEIAGLRAELTADRAAFDEAKRQALAQVTAAATTYCKAVESIERRLAALAKRNGWSEV